MKVGILGYGNLGRGVESAIRQNDDMELTCIITRRDPKSITPATEGVKVYSVDEGEWYEDQEEFIEYAKRVYREAPFFDDLEARGYRMGMYEEEAYRLEESMLRFENMIDTTPTISSIAQFMKLEIKLVGFKYMPFDLKRFCLTIPAEFNSLEKTDDISDYELFSSDNQVFYTYLEKTPVTLTDDKCFRFIHLVGAHSPWHQDAQMNEIENGTYEQSIEASMTIVATYLQKLKDSGVYDNTAIMILSDSTEIYS